MPASPSPFSAGRRVARWSECAGLPAVRWLAAARPAILLRVLPGGERVILGGLLASWRRRSMLLRDCPVRIAALVWARKNPRSAWAGSTPVRFVRGAHGLGEITHGGGRRPACHAACRRSQLSAALSCASHKTSSYGPPPVPQQPRRFHCGR